MVLDGASVISYDGCTSIWLAARSTYFYMLYGRSTEFPRYKKYSDKNYFKLNGKGFTSDMIFGPLSTKTA